MSEKLRVFLAVILIIVLLFLVWVAFDGLAEATKKRNAELEAMFARQRMAKQTCYDNGYTGVKWAGERAYCFNTMPDEIVSVESLRE